MKTLQIGETLYKELQEVAHIQGKSVREFLPKVLEEGISVIKEEAVLGLYRKREISLQRAAEMLSVDIWTIIEKIQEADIHLDYTLTELNEDISI